MRQKLPAEGDRITLQDPIHKSRQKTVKHYAAKELLVPVFRAGQRVYAVPDIAAIQGYHRQEMETIWDTYKQLDEPEEYPVNPIPELVELQHRLIAEKRARL